MSKYLENQILEHYNGDAHDHSGLVNRDLAPGTVHKGDVVTNEHGEHDVINIVGNDGGTLAGAILIQEKPDALGRKGSLGYLIEGTVFDVHCPGHTDPGTPTTTSGPHSTL